MCVCIEFDTVYQTGKANNVYSASAYYIIAHYSVSDSVMKQPWIASHVTLLWPSSPQLLEPRRRSYSNIDIVIYQYVMFIQTSNFKCHCHWHCQWHSPCPWPCHCHWHCHWHCHCHWPLALPLALPCEVVPGQEKQNTKSKWIDSGYLSIN